MLGFLIGTVCLIGFLKLARFGRRGRWGRGRGRFGHFSGSDGGGYGRGGYGDPRDFGGYDPYDDRGREGWGGDHGGRGRGRGGPFGGWIMMRRLFARLDTTPAQENVIKSALDELKGTAKKLRGDAKAARPELANAVRQEQFDETLFGEISHKIDEAAQSMRRATIDAVAKVHSVLDERQKKILADLIESGPRFRGFGGPYRGGMDL